MIHIRKFNRILSSLRKPIPTIPTYNYYPTTSLTHRPLHSLATQKPTTDSINQTKEKGKEFYQNHIENIIELQKVKIGSPSSEDALRPYSSTSMPIGVDHAKNSLLGSRKGVNQSGGKLKLLKINIDKFGQIAQAFQIKGVPTVYMVHGGKAIDAFTGELNEEQLTKFLQTAGRVAQPDAEELAVVKCLEQGQMLIREKKYEQAEKVLTAIKYSKVREEFKLVGDIFLGLVYSQLGKMVQLKSSVETMKVNALFYTQKPQFESLFSHLCQQVQNFEKEKQENSESGSWKQRLQAEPNNLALKYQAAQFYRANAMIEECLEQLLGIIKANKEWEDKKANKEMLAIFKELGNSSPLVQTYRKHLQRTMY